MNRIGGKIRDLSRNALSEVHSYENVLILFHRKSKRNTGKKSAALSTSDDDNSEKENFANDSDDVLFE